MDPLYFLGLLAQWKQETEIAFWTTAVLGLSGLWVAIGSEETHPGLNPAGGSGSDG